MERDLVDIVHEGYDGWSRRDLEAVLANMAPEVEWISVGEAQFPGTKTRYVGHEGVRIQHVHEAGSGTVVVEGRFRGTTAGAGVTVDEPFVHVLTFREDGKMVRHAGYADREAAFAAAGLSEPR